MPMAFSPMGGPLCPHTQKKGHNYIKMAQKTSFKSGGEIAYMTSQVFIAKALMFLWCIATDPSLVSSSPYDDLTPYGIFKALS